MTTEREGVRSHRQFAIASTQDVVQIPITEADAPNVYVSVLLIKGRTATDIDPAGEDHGCACVPRRLHGDPRWTIRRNGCAWRCGSDHTEYRPKQPATVSVAVTDAADAPAPSEVTLWAVDYGLFSLTGYPTPDVLARDLRAPDVAGAVTRRAGRA